MTWPSIDRLHGSWQKQNQKEKILSFKHVICVCELCDSHEVLLSVHKIDPVSVRIFHILFYYSNFTGLCKTNWLKINNSFVGFLKHKCCKTVKFSTDSFFFILSVESQGYFLLLHVALSLGTGSIASGIGSCNSLQV